MHAKEKIELMWLITSAQIDLRQIKRPWSIVEAAARSMVDRGGGGAMQ